MLMKNVYVEEYCNGEEYYNRGVGSTDRQTY